MKKLLTFSSVSARVLNPPLYLGCVLGEESSVQFKLELKTRSNLFVRSQKVQSPYRDSQTVPFYSVLGKGNRRSSALFVRLSLEIRSNYFV